MPNEDVTNLRQRFTSPTIRHCLLINYKFLVGSVSFLMKVLLVWVLQETAPFTLPPMHVSVHGENKNQGNFYSNKIDTA